MANNWDKIVKLACKPKSAAPKAKYLDSIIATTYSDDGSLRDVFAALAVRLRDSSNVVIHKALLVIHTMIRMGHTDNVLTFLSGSNNDVLKLRHIANGQNDGHLLSGNISNYAGYLETRIRAYRDLRHDVIRVQNENNREDRLSGGDSSRETNGAGVSRSKTVGARKLRQLTVEKGLLRETKGVQRQIDSLLQCKFFLDSLEDELVLTTLRLLVKDLLILFQAGNEGVINVLEQYFEMSSVDAEQSLELYKSFCTQTEGVVEFLSIARKLSNLLNVPVPNLRHAPTRLAGALEEYLRDPNFEQNRIEYKTNKALADGKIPNKSKPQPKKEPEVAPEVASSTGASSSKGKGKPASIQPTIDLLQSIEESQPTMFNPQTDSPSMTWFQQGQGQSNAAAVAYNPFRQPGIAPQVTGMPVQPFVLPQATGMVPSASPFVQPPVMPQVTGFPAGMSPFPQASASPFAQPQPQVVAMQTGVFQPAQPAIAQPQPTGFLQPQVTGTNPFRQSILLPQTTGSPFSQSSGPFAQPRSASALTFSVPPLPTQSASSNQPATTSPSPFAAALINRPASTPITSNNGPSLRPVVSHQTGSRNPFGQPKAPSPPPVPKPPTLAELAFGGGNALQPVLTGVPSTFNPQQTNASIQQPFSAQLASALGNNANTNNTGSANMSSVASAFAVPNANKSASPPPVPTLVMPALTAQTTSTTALSDTFSNFSLATSTGTTTTASSFGASPLQPQMTGFAGLKAFKPTSSFGAALLESLPSSAATSTAPSAVPSPINGPGAGATASQLGSGSSGLGAFGGSNTSLGTPGALNTQRTGATLSPFSSSLTPVSSGAAPSLPSFNLPTGSLNAQPTGASPSPFLSGLGSGSASPFTQSPGASALGGGLSSGTGSTIGVGLRPQMTGGGVNPFRASMAMGGSGSGLLGQQQQPGLMATTHATGLNGFSGLSGSTSPSMGANLFAGVNSAFRPTLATIPSFTGGLPGSTPQQPSQPQQQPQSLI
ncbi:hypothetical protein FRC17_009507 [Serendipita sp. 399]|nr:hypothetical protein FRC17_009507 [Serendipita sp. 399]